MVVQHNLTALNSNRLLGLTSKAQAKSTEKLSSGYKINRAADDAAGLAISEKMRKQIRGLTQASANAQDGISAVQTAEGALTEVHDMLQRMNELAVKAANGTNSESDRQAIQSEIDQLVTEIDRVAETTKFNETYLLKGDKSIAKSYSYSYKAVKESVAATAVMDSDAATGLSAEITFTKGAKASDQNELAKALRDQGITITSETEKDKDGKDVTKFGVTLNGKAAANYNVNTKSNDEFEIVDLQGNQIATVKASIKGVKTEEAEPSLKWETDAATAQEIYATNDGGNDQAAVKVTADNFTDYFELDADGKVAVKAGYKFYDATDTTAGTEVTDVSGYVSVEEGGEAASKGTVELTGATKLYDETGKELTADEAAALLDKDAATKLYKSVDFDYTSSNAGLSGISVTDAVTGTLKYDGTDWKDEAGNTVTANVTIGTGTAANNDTITIALANTSEEAKADTDYTYTPAAPAAAASTGKKSAVVTASEIEAAQNANDVAKFYDKDGNVISSNALGNYFSVLSPEKAEEADADSEEAVRATITDGTTLYDKDGKAIADADALLAILDADKDAALYTDKKLKGNASNAAVTAVSGIPTGAAIGTVYTYVAGGNTLPNGGTANAGQAGWYDMTDKTDTVINLNVTGGEANGDTVTVAFDSGAATAAVKDTDYTYTPEEEPEEESEAGDAATVAAKAGYQLYDAVGNKISMTEAADSVSANQNLTGALNLKLHVGADATSNNQIDLNIQAMSAKGLGLNGLKVAGSDDSSSLSAINTIQEAIQKVSSQRSILGAVQNRLEHTINNLDNVVENTTSAESAIRDTDMATEMVKYANNNILAQAGQSMLAQANQSNQGVLSLLG